MIAIAVITSVLLVGYFVSKPMRKEARRQSFIVREAPLLQEPISSVPLNNDFNPVAEARAALGPRWDDLGGIYTPDQLDLIRFSAVNAVKQSHQP